MNYQLPAFYSLISAQVTPQFVEKRHRKLEQWLKERGFTPVEVDGELDQVKEKSFLVPTDGSPRHLRLIEWAAKKFKQSYVIHATKEGRQELKRLKRIRLPKLAYTTLPSGETLALRTRLKKTAIALFVKYPIPGNVKTRLAATVGSRQAIDIYKSILNRVGENVLLRLPPSQFDVFIFGDPSASEKDYRVLMGLQCRVKLHRKDATFGERLSEAFSTLLTKYRSAIVLASDVPDVTLSDIKMASEIVKQGRAVIGPSSDGGYYMLGLPTPLPQLFQGITWSTSEVLNQTEAKAKEVGLEMHRLSTRDDIDDEESYRKWLREMERGE